MSAQLLGLLKFSLLALLYLFLFRVVRAVWAELAPPDQPLAPPSSGRGRGRRRRPPPSEAPVPAMAGASSTSATTSAPTPATEPRRPRRPGRRSPPVLVIREPADRAGTRFDLADELTIGRAGGCGITIDDTFASQLHARLFRDGDHYFIEDLGSTNGTHRNDQPVSGPQQLARGDLIRLGNTVLEFT
ncbi:MAG: FHA domain-containing protein [Acidimicrobiia bacterium]|nr:FHA domain-containing protein [Acidimicrobiia bacterium]